MGRRTRELSRRVQQRRPTRQGDQSLQQGRRRHKLNGCQNYKAIAHLIFARALSPKGEKSEQKTVNDMLCF